MKKFSVISAFLFATISALACGPWMRPHYYTFSVFNRNEETNPFLERLNQNWKIYDSSIDDYDMQGLNWVSLENFDQTQNAIVTAARNKGDDEMLLYLRLLITYLEECRNVDVDNEWGYPTKNQQQQSSRRIDYIYNAARTYEGTRLRPQYCLLQMRCLMLRGDNQNIIKFWSNTGVKLPPSVFRDMMQDIYAGALLRTGKRAEACRLYGALGDMQSIKWILRDDRDLDGIRKEYAADPNSPTLTFLVQDFVNNAEETLCSLSYENENERTQELAAFNRQLDAFKTLASQAVNNKDCKSPAMWQSAIGYLQYLQGNPNAAITTLEKAQKMNGTQRMRDNARTCLIVAQAEAAADNNKFYSQTAKNLQWLIETDKKEFPNAANPEECEGHYGQVLSNVVYDQLIPTFGKWNKPNLVTALYGWMNRKNNRANSGFAIGNEYGIAVDSLTAEQMIDYADYIKGSPHNDLERMMFASNISIPENWVNDLVGTKMIREGRFTEAISYLENVPVSFIGSQNINRYMSRRDYNVERWLKRQVVDRNWEDIYEGDKNSTKAINQKLDFCRSALALIDKIHITNNATAEDYYRLANLYYQASYKGDCWYLSRYGNSVYDSVCYKKEMDFVAEAVHLLDDALEKNAAAYKSNNEAAYDLQQKILYARAFIPFGEPMFYYTWDANYNQTEHTNRNAYQYRALLDLNDFYNRNFYRGVEPYISKCDVLKEFRKKN